MIRYGWYKISSNDCTVIVLLLIDKVMANIMPVPTVTNLPAAIAVQETSAIVLQEAPGRRFANAYKILGVSQP